MGTAVICFLFSAIGFLPLAFFWFGMRSTDPEAAKQASSWFAAFLLPCSASTFFWFFAGMIFLWLQRIRDAINNTTKAIDKLRREGLVVRQIPPE